MTSEELIYTLALTHIPKIGDITAKKLIEICGSAKAVLNASETALQRIDGIGTKLAQVIRYEADLKDAEREYNYLTTNKYGIWYYKDEDYPAFLRHCPDGPVLLFSKGQINLNSNRIISVIGTRKITNSGKAFCNTLIKGLAAYNPIIVSGFAYGTDITAQKAAIDNNLQTIGCLAHGFQMIYPRAHNKYVKDVEANGGFLTDFWSTDTFERNNFLKRNRIIAGLSQATVVVESAEKGGSLTTADIAQSYNRDVFAVPGRPSDAMSKGCNALIKIQKAQLINEPLDVVKFLNWDIELKKTPQIQTELFVNLNEEEQKLVELLKVSQRLSMDKLALISQIPNYKVASILLTLELKGVIRPLPGKQFELA